MIQRLANFILCDDYLLPSRLCIGKVHLKIRSHKRVEFEVGLCILRDLRHEYERGCNLLRGLI